MLLMKSYKVYFYFLVIFVLIFAGLFRIVLFTKKINDYIIHDQGILLSISINPLEAILSGKGLTYPGTGYGSVLSAYLIYPATFLPVDLLTVWIFLNLVFRFLVFYVLGLFLALKGNIALSFFVFLVPIIIPSDSVFTWGYYAFAEVEIISIILIIYILINKKYKKLIFFVLGLFLVLDLRSLPLIFSFVIAYIFIFNNHKKETIKLIICFLVGALATFAYTYFFIKNDTFLLSSQIPTLTQTVERINTGFNIFVSHLGNPIFIFIVFLWIFQHIKFAINFSVKKFGKLMLLNLLLFTPIFLLMVNSRVIESYSYFNANRIFLFTLPSIVLYFYYVNLIENSKKSIITNLTVIILLSFLIIQFNKSYFYPTKELSLNGPSPAFDRIKLKEGCEDFYLKEEARAVDNYLLTHRWELAYICEALLSPSKHARLVNTNPFSGGEIRPWRREKVPN